MIPETEICNPIQLFKDNGWTIEYRRDTVVATHPDPRIRNVLICEKYFGGEDYRKEIQQAFLKMQEKGLIGTQELVG